MVLHLPSLRRQRHGEHGLDTGEHQHLLVLRLLKVRVAHGDAVCDFEVDETGETFEENAFLKAEAAMKATGLPAVSDDRPSDTGSAGSRIFSAMPEASVTPVKNVSRTAPKSR